MMIDMVCLAVLWFALYREVVRTLVVCYGSLLKESLNSDDQQLHQYQQNGQSPPTLTH